MIRHLMTLAVALRISLRLSVFSLAAIASVPAAAAVHLPRVFSDGMVLQRENPVPVWGWGDPGENISVNFGGQEQRCVAGADGAWTLRLNPLAAEATPRELIVTGTNSITFHNVIVGDVWLCSGDFGAYWEVFACVDSSAEIGNADYPAIRLLKVATKTSNAPLKEIGGEWKVCSPKTISGFSGLAYFFGRELHRELKVPIGLIDCSYRYSYMRSWLAPDGFRLVPELKMQRERLDSWEPTTPTGRQAFISVINQVEQWLPKAQEAFEKGAAIPPQPLTPAPVTARDDNYNSIGELSVAYQGMVRPLIPFAIRGVVWSQGENGGEFELMQPYLRGLCESWRRAWGQGDFPVYFELLPRVGEPSAAPCTGDGWIAAREGQLKALSISNTGMAVTFDVSDYVQEKRNRQDPGRRFALVALAREYHKDIEFSGPLYRSHQVVGKSITISFDHSRTGLLAGEKKDLLPVHELNGGNLKGFAVAGADKQWHVADARIVGETVVMQSDRVPSPVAVRYAWCANPQGANLYNRARLPAAPFRTANW